MSLGSSKRTRCLKLMRYHSAYLDMLVASINCDIIHREYMTTSRSYS